MISFWWIFRCLQWTVMRQPRWFGRYIRLQIFRLSHCRQTRLQKTEKHPSRQVWTTMSPNQSRSTNWKQRWADLWRILVKNHFAAFLCAIFALYQWMSQKEQEWNCLKMLKISLARITFQIFITGYLWRKHFNVHGKLTQAEQKHTEHRNSGENSYGRIIWQTGSSTLCGDGFCKRFNCSHIAVGCCPE